MSSGFWISNPKVLPGALGLFRPQGWTPVSVIKWARKYIGDLHEFGWGGFEIQTFETAGGQRREYADLNQELSSLLF